MLKNMPFRITKPCRGCLFGLIMTCLQHYKTLTSHYQSRVFSTLVFIVSSLRNTHGHVELPHLFTSHKYNSVDRGEEKWGSNTEQNRVSQCCMYLMSLYRKMVKNAATAIYVADCFAHNLLIFARWWEICYKVQIVMPVYKFVNKICP